MSVSSRTTDISAVPLPPPWAGGLLTLMERFIVGSAASGDAATAAKAVLVALFGKDAPTFGQVARISARDLQTACGQAGLGADALPVANLKELAELLPLVKPETPICDECGAFPLSGVGGKVMTLAAGSSCPFCADGALAIVPMRLRKLAWTDGRLVEPQTTHDMRAFPGTSIPLDDAALMAWVGGWINKSLELALRDANVPLYAWLACMHLKHRALPSYVEVADLLQEPKSFGLGSDAAIKESVAEAATFLSEREVTNVPRRTHLPFIKGDIDALTRMTVAGRSYVVEGRVGSGDKCDVYRGAWDNPDSERVIIKVCRGGVAEAKKMAREVSNLTSLYESRANGTAFMARLLPSVVATGSLPGPDGTLRAVTVFRYKHRFDWTLADVIKEYPEGVEPETMVWMWNRCLLLLRWLQMNDMVHGALVPEHVLIHPGYHGATFLDWAHAVRIGGRRVPIVEPLGDRHAAFLPKEVANGEPATFETDVAMSARCMIAVLAGNPATGEMTASVPAPIADFLRAHARCEGLGDLARVVDGEGLEKAFGKVTAAVYGKRRFHPFSMPRTTRL